MFKEIHEFETQISNLSYLGDYFEIKVPALSSKRLDTKTIK